MVDITSKLKFSKPTFPKLTHKHIKELKNNGESEILYSKQAHEIYTYTFFQNVKMEHKERIKIGNIEGIAISPVKLECLEVSNSITEKEYFEALLNAPVPFVFIPSCEYSELKNFCNSAMKCIGKEQNAMLMSLEFCCAVGIDFIAVDFLKKGDIAFLYVGLVYCK